MLGSGAGFPEGVKREEILFDFPAALDRCWWETSQKLSGPSVPHVISAGKH